MVHPESRKVVDNFFRQEYSKIAAVLVSYFGAGRIELVEDALQDSMLKAMRLWPYSGIPAKPSHWMFVATKNRVLDKLRREARETAFAAGELAALQTIEPPKDVLLDAEIRDSQLGMIFVCCHPALSPESRIMLSLKLLCGLGVTEIARGLFKSEEAVARAISRAKVRLRHAALSLELPQGAELRLRMQTVQTILYLLFNEGYQASRGETIVKHDICFEAMRLCKLLFSHPAIASNELRALFALMCLQASRFEARLETAGGLLTLEQQDRRLWDAELISAGLYYLKEATSTPAVSVYHLQAAIASEHCLAADFAATNWRKILFYYDSLLELSPSLAIRLNRIIAVCHVEGASSALQEWRSIKRANPQASYLSEAAAAYLYKKLDEPQEELKYLQSALPLVHNNAETRFLLQRCRQLQQNQAAKAAL